MLTTVRVLRVLAGLIAAWQIIGLLPVLTNWLPHLENVTGGMWAIAFVKVLVMLICAGIYFWLGKIKSRIEGAGKSTSEGRLIVFAVLAVLAIGVALAIAIPALSDRGRKASDTPIRPAQPAANHERIESTQYAKPPTFDSEGWTQESTKSAESGPWLTYDPPGTRYYRDSNRIIYRVYPPGVRPDGEKANPFGLMESSDRPPQ